MRVFTRVLIVMAAAAVIAGCDADPQAGCTVECPVGQYCGANGKCTFDCKLDSDCGPGKKCSTQGRCVDPSGKDLDTPQELGGVIKDGGGNIHHDDGVPDQGGLIQDDGVPKDTGGVKLDTGGVKLDTGGTKLDTGGTKLDTGGVKLDTGGAKLDKGMTFDGWAGPDGGKFGVLNCAAIAACGAKCSSTPCIQACTCQGTVPAQTKYKALLLCIQNASAGACATPCKIPGSSACGACAQKICDAEYKACHFGPPTTGFGDKCSQSAPCSTGFFCAMLQPKATVGFCSKQCYKSAAFCAGVPTGTEAYCLLDDGKGKNFCGFLCKYKQYGTVVTVSCPKSLTCSATENPAGSGQHFCVP